MPEKTIKFIKKEKQHKEQLHFLYQSDLKQVQIYFQNLKNDLLANIEQQQ